MRGLKSRIAALLFALILPNLLQGQKQASDSLLKVLQGQENDTTGVRTMVEIAAGMSKTNPTEAIPWAKKALRLSRKLKDEYGIAESYYQIGVCQYMQNQTDSAFQSIDGALEIYTKLHQSRKIWKVKFMQAQMHNRINQLEESDSLMKESLELARRENWPKEEAMSLEGLAGNLAFQRKFDEAIPLLDKVIELKTKNKMGPELSLTYFNMAGICYNLGDYDCALRNFLRADSIKAHYGAPAPDRILALVTIGEIYARNKQSEKAVNYLDSAMAMAVVLRDSYYIGRTEEIYGSSYYYSGEYAKAIPYLERGLYLLQKFSDHDGYHATAYYLSLCYLAEDRCEEALEASLIILECAKQTGVRDIYHTAYNALAETSAKMGNLSDAVYYLRKQIEYTDAEVRKDQTEKLAELETKYRASEKQHEVDVKSAELRRVRWVNTLLSLSGMLACAFILLLANRTRIMRRSKRVSEENNRLLEIQKEHIENEKENMELKALLSQMNPHFIFNALASIQNFILENQPDIASDYLARFGLLMRLILEHSEKKTVLLRDELRLLNIYIELEQARLGHNFDWELEIDPSIREDQVYIPPMMIQPFLENSIWHGLAPLTGRRGRLRLSLKPDPQGILCRIEDNGIGLEKSAENRKTASSRNITAMTITRKRIETLWHKHNNSAQTVSATGLTGPDGKPQGTLISFYLPISNTEGK